MKKNRIQSIRILHKIDEYPDLSYLGEYTDRKPYKEDLNRKSAFYRYYAERNEYKYFIPAYSVSEHRNDLQKIGYSKGVSEEMARQYCKSDFDRMEAYNRGDWYAIGIIAEAIIELPCNGYKKMQVISSGGLWGIDSDSGSKYIEEIENEQLSELKEYCMQVNVYTKNWDNIEIQRPEY